MASSCVGCNRLVGLKTFDNPGGLLTGTIDYDPAKTWFTPALAAKVTFDNVNLPPP